MLPHQGRGIQSAQGSVRLPYGPLFWIKPEKIRMTFAKIFLLLASIATLASPAAAQAPAQTAPAKVGVVDSTLFADPTNGIKRLIAVQRTLEAEFKPKRDAMLKK